MDLKYPFTIFSENADELIIEMFLIKIYCMSYRSYKLFDGRPLYIIEEKLDNQIN